MQERKMTAVEWFGKKVLDVITTDEFNDLLEQAKQMEKEQMKVFYGVGREYQRGEYESEESYNKFSGFQKPNNSKNFEQYYNETFKSE